MLVASSLSEGMECVNGRTGLNQRIKYCSVHSTAANNLKPLIVWFGYVTMCEKGEKWKQWKMFTRRDVI